MPRRAFLAVIIGAIGAAASPASGQVLRDANCDGVVNDADPPALVGALFVPGMPSCPSSDINRDGRVSAADLIAFALGPRISYIGITSPDGRPAQSLGTLSDGTPVYFRNAGFGFLFVVETEPSVDGASIGTDVFNSALNDPTRRPDLQILVDQQLGDGSPAVCDDFGIPAVAPPTFALTQPVSNALNDLACRFNVATTRSSTCTQDRFGQPAFVSSASRAQFCLPVNSQMAFATGETRITVQIRDVTGLVGPVQQMVLQVGSGPAPPTFTPLPPTPTRTATATSSLTPIASATRPNTLTPTTTRTRIATASSTPTAAASPTARTAMATATRTRTSTGPPAATSTVTRAPTSPPATATATRTSAGPPPTPTRTPAGTGTRMPISCVGDCDGSGNVTVPELITLVSIALSGGDATPCLAGDANGDGQITVDELVAAVANALTGCPSMHTSTPTGAQSPTATVGGPTPVLTGSPTPTPTGAANGPLITFLGLTVAEGFLIQPSDMSGTIPIYKSPLGYNFAIVVEAKPGGSRARVATSTYNPGGTPDLQIEATQPLGNGSMTVCDNSPPIFGGVPAINPPDFGDDPGVADRLNDLGCRFINGVDMPAGHPCSDNASCVLGTDGQFNCAGQGSTEQFCGFMGQILAFPSGDTLVTAAVRDTSGNLGPLGQLIIRVP